MTKRILIVDDERKWRGQLTAVLQHAEYKLDTAKGFDSASTKLEKNEYDLVLVDIFLDALGFRGEGGRLFALLHEKYPNTPAIAISVVPKPIPLSRVRDLFVEYGITDFIDKRDFDVKRFRQMVYGRFDDYSANIEASLRAISQEISKLSGLADILDFHDQRLVKKAIRTLAIQGKSTAIVNQKIEAVMPIIPFFVHWKGELELNELGERTADLIDRVSIGACERVLTAWAYLKSRIT